MLIRGQNWDPRPNVKLIGLLIPAQTWPCWFFFRAIGNRVVSFIQEDALSLTNEHSIILLALKIHFLKLNSTINALELTEKYVVPLMVPLFFPFASSKTTPTHRPTEKEENIFTCLKMKTMSHLPANDVRPTYWIVPLMPLSLISTLDPFLSCFSAIVQPKLTRNTITVGRKFCKFWGEFR